MLRAVALLALLCAVACNDDTTQFVFDARIVDGEGGNPAAGTDATALAIQIVEGDSPVREFEYPVVDGQFDASLEFASFNSLTRLRIEIEGPTTELITAPPAFVPSASLGFLRVVPVSPSTCVPVSFTQMEAPRADFGMVQAGTFALLVGGASVSDEQIEFFDALEWEARLFVEDFSVSFLGATRAATVGDGRILVLPAEATPFVFDMLDATNRVTEVILHDGRGASSAIVSIPGVGAAVLGGESAGIPTDVVSLVEPDGSVRRFSLTVPRAGAVATAMGEDVLIVGGDGTGSAEILSTNTSASAPVEGVSDGTRRGGLLVGDGQSRALLIGGADSLGATRTDTLRFDDCPGSCAARVGPSWDMARLRAVVPEGSALVVGGEDSSLVERVRWSDDTVAIEPLVQMTSPRASAGAIVYESGVFVVAGGDDGMGPREDFEACVPAALEPL